MIKKNKFCLYLLTTNLQKRLSLPLSLTKTLASSLTPHTRVLAQISTKENKTLLTLTVNKEYMLITTRSMGFQ